MGFSPNNEAKIDDRPFLLKEERETKENQTRWTRLESIEK